MTQDTLIKPAETEEQATQTEAELDSTSDSEVAGGEEQAGDSTEATPTADEALQSFLKERDLTTETESSTEEQKPQNDSSSPQVDETVVQSRVNAELDRARRTAEQEGIRQAFQTRAENIRNYLMSNGFDPVKANLVVNEFNAHHAQSAPIAKEEAASELREAFANHQFTVADKYVPGIKARRAEFKDSDEFISAIVEGARKGLVKESEVKTRINAELVAYKKTLEKLKIIPGSKAVPDGESGGGTGSKSADAILDDPNATAEQLEKAFKSKYGIDFPA